MPDPIVLTDMKTITTGKSKNIYNKGSKHSSNLILILSTGNGTRFGNLLVSLSLGFLLRKMGIILYS